MRDYRLKSKNGGQGFTVGIEPNSFGNPVDTRDQAIAARDNQANNAAWLAEYDKNSNQGIYLLYKGLTGPTVETQTRNNGVWDTNRSFVAIKGDPGEATDLASVTDGYVVYKAADGTFKDAPIKIENGKPVFASDPVLNPGAIDFGYQSRLTAMGSLLGMESKVSGNKFINLLQYFNRDDFGDAFYFDKNITESGDNQVLHSDYSSPINSPINFTVSSQTNDINTKLYFKTTGIISDFKFKIVSDTTGKEMYYFPNKLAWDGDSKGLDLVAGNNVIDLFTNVDERIAPILLIPGTFHITIKYSGVGKILGSPLGIPYYAADIIVFDTAKIASEKFVTDLTTPIQTEVDRLKTYKPTIANDKIYVFRDKGIPTSLPAGFKEYYIHSILLRDSTGVISIPTGLVEDTIICVENNDRNDFLYLQTPVGETINGKGSFKCEFDTLNYFVKEGTDWKLAFGGIFPNTITAMMSTIKANLPANSGLSIQDIQNTLKDRLHTFREIQNEFSGQLHTLNEIEVDMENRGFSKGFDIIYDLVKTKPTDGSTVTGTPIEPNQVVISPVGLGNRFPVFIVPEEFTDLVSSIKVGGTSIETDKVSFEKTGKRYVMLVSTNVVDLSASEDIHLEYKIDKTTSGGGSGSGITIDDGTTNKAGIDTVNVEGMFISNEQGSTDEVTVRAVTSWAQEDGSGGGRVNEVHVEEPLQVYIDPDTKPGENERVKVRLQHGYFELKKPPCYLAYLTEPEEVVGIIKQGESGTREGAIWFDDIVVGSSTYLSTSRADKSFSLEDYDPSDDPNVSGGKDFLIAYRVSLKGKAVEDGFVEIMLRSVDKGTTIQDGKVIKDSNGNPIGVRKQYKAGDDLGVLEAISVYKAKGLAEIQCRVAHSFIEDGIMLEDRTDGCSGIMLQALDKDYKTGDALVQFENDTQQNIEFTSHYLGPDIFNSTYALSFNRALVDITVGTGQTSVDGLHFYNNTNLKVGVANGVATIQDNGNDTAYFSFGKIFSAEKAYLLRGKDLDVSITLQDKQNSYRIYMVKWTGSPDKYTEKVISGYDVDSGAIADTDWVLDGNVFISEDPISGEHKFSGVLTVPADAVNFAIVLVPGVKQTPVSLKLKEFKVDVSEYFTGYLIESPELVNEKHLEFSKSHVTFEAGNPGYQSFRYTLNNKADGSPMPIGIVSKGKADIVLDQTVNQVPGSSNNIYEGALKFQRDGEVIIDTEVYIWSEQATSVIAQTSFWYAKVSADGSTFTKILLSELNVGIRGGTKAINRMPRFKLTVKDGDRIALFAKTDRADGAYIEAISGDKTPMVKVTIDFDEIVAVQNSLDLFGQNVVFTQEALDNDVYIEVDYVGNKPKVTAKVR